MITLKPLSFQHFNQIIDIYGQGVATGIATFQNSANLEWSEWDKSHLQNCRIGAFEENVMLGWAALTLVSNRCVYEGVAEVSIYIASLYRGKGVGKMILSEIITESEKNGIWTLQSGIFSENISSIQLHEKCCFRQVGYREKIGKKDGIWKDNIIMERRSNIIGI